MSQALERVSNLIPLQRNSPRQPAVIIDMPTPEAYYGTPGGLGYNHVYSIGYTGEKNLGEMGPIVKYIIDHQALRLRSWQLFLESEICQTVFKRFARWVIGSGLKLQAEPQNDVLKGEKIILAAEEFNKEIESRFKLFAGSRMSDWAGMKNLHERANEAFLNAIVGGDCLVILRYDDEVKVQLVDGAHVANPAGLSFAVTDFKTAEGNVVRHGVELDATGQHVAYYVRKGLGGMDFDRIPARGEESGRLMAFMVYGLEYRLDNVRGIPLISAVMETAKKMERYKEATLGSAEERAKVAFFIEHDPTSTGENPLQKQLAKVSGHLRVGDDTPVDVRNQRLADTVAATTNKAVFNMPNGSKMSQLISTNELQFEPFFSVNINLVCATVGIPPNVAMMLYDNNYSASRAAMKDWEHTLSVERERIGNQYYNPVYALFLDTQVLKNKVTAPGYLNALAKDNKMAILAYRSCRWVGAQVPHIDPLKEVNAWRAKLGAGSAHMPLATIEEATEALNGGESYSNMEQYAAELQKAEELGIKRVEIAKEIIEDFEDDSKPEPPKKEGKPPVKKTKK